MPASSPRIRLVSDADPAWATRYKARETVAQNMSTFPVNGSVNSTDDNKERTMASEYEKEVCLSRAHMVRDLLKMRSPNEQVG